MLKKLLIFFGLATIVLASSWSLTKPGMFPLHDFTHAARIAELARSLMEGHFPVRWSANFGYGYGMPLFQFYAPLPYYLGALLWLVGLPMFAVIKILFFLTNLGTALGSYWLGRSLFGRGMGLLIATAITLAPYRAVNLFVRGALNESFGIMAAVWVLWGLVAVLQRQRGGWIILVLSWVMLFLSHNLMTLIFTPFAVLFAAGFWAFWCLPSWKNFSWVDLKPLLLTAGCALWASALSAFYLIPSFFEKGYTQVESLVVGGYFDYRLHFVYVRQLFQENWGYGGSGWGPHDGMSFFLGFGQWLGVILSVLIIAAVYWQKLAKGQSSRSWWDWLRPTRRLWLYDWLLLLLGLSLFLTLTHAQGIWDRFELMSFIQFPWRFLGASLIFAGLLIGFGVAQLTRRSHRFWLSLLIFLIMIVPAGRYFTPEYFFEESDPYTDSESVYYTDAKRIQTSMSSILLDYLPTDFDQNWVAHSPRGEAILACQTKHDGCEFPLETLVDRGHEKLVRVVVSQPTTIEFLIADFPGWQAEVDGRVVPTFTTSRGTLALAIPSGERQLGVRFTNTPLRQAADATSTLAWLIFISLVVFGKRWSGMIFVCQKR